MAGVPTKPRVGPQLHFPENNNYQLLGLLPGVDKLAKEAETPAAGQLRWRICSARWVPYSAHSNRHFQLAGKRLGLYIVAGGFPPEGGKVYNRALLYAPTAACWAARIRCT